MADTPLRYSPTNPPPSWDSMSLGADTTKIRKFYRPCPISGKDHHECRCVSMVQSIGHFVCIHCGFDWYD